MSPLIIVASLVLLQCPPGRICPPPSPTMGVFTPTYFTANPLPAQAPAPARPPRSEWAWHRVRVDGSSRWVWGWVDGANIAWIRTEQPPELPAAMLASLTPRPTPREPETPPKAEQPAEPSPAVVGALPSFATSGVDRTKLALRTGYQARHDAAQRFVESEVKATQVPEDKDKPRLTVIGVEADVGPVMALTKGSGPLARLASEFHVQSYAPDSPYVSGLGFAQGKPAIYVQTATGRVLHRQTDFAGGEAALVTAIERSGALRKPDPAYQPAKDPDHRQVSPSLASLDLETSLPWLALGIACFFAALAPRPKRRSS